MAKVIRNVDKDQQEFIKTLDTLTNRFQRWQIWYDFIVMFATSISNSIDKAHFEKREKFYMEVTKKYTEKEMAVFPQLCAIVVTALEADKDRDFLGEMYMALDLGSHWHGQFFTPYDVCKAMAEITCGNVLADIKEKGFITANDPACGAGALLIAYANVAERVTQENGYTWQNHILFTAQDIDMVTGLMCYIQLSLLGCAGYVKIANTLTEPMADGEAQRELTNPDSVYWYTPMYFSDVWHYRRVCRMLDRFINSSFKQDADKQNKKTVEPETDSKDDEGIEFVTDTNGQLSLF